MNISQTSLENVMDYSNPRDNVSPPEKVENGILQATFFKGWRVQTSKLKLKKFENFSDLLGIHIDVGNLEINRFNQLTQLKKFELIKSVLFLGKSVDDHLGRGPNLKKIKKFESYIPNILPQFDDDQRFILAQIDMARHGIEALKKYHLPQAQEIALTHEAKKQVEALLPDISDELIEECIKANDIKTLQFHFFRRFSGRFRIRKSHEALYWEAREASQSINIHSTETLRSILDRTKAIQEEHFLQAGWVQYPSLPEDRPPHWGQDNGIKGEEIIPFSHGGGFFYALQFLTGKIQGYHLELGGKGIQVSPGGLEDPRDQFYAGRSVGHMDYPVRISGKIKAKYLDSADNDYEAGLRPDFIDFIEDLKITRLDTGEVHTLTPDRELIQII